MPQEIFFGAFLLITWARLVFATGFFSMSSLFYLALIGVNVAAIRFYRPAEAAWRWRVGLLFYPVAMNLVFAQMKVAIPAINPRLMDSALQAIDSLMIGENLSLRLQAITHPVLTELFSICYILFFPYLLFSMVYYFSSDVALLKKFVAGLFTVYGIGFLGYSFVPASGPYIAMADQFQQPLTGFLVTGWNAAVVAKGSNGVDVFPSLHCAVSAFFLFFDRKHRPWRFWIYLAPCVGLWISTIYLRYHYLIDVIIGFLLAAFALGVANRCCETNDSSAVNRSSEPRIHNHNKVPT